VHAHNGAAVMRRLVAICISLVAAAAAANAEPRPDFVPAIGSQVDLGASFTDETGRAAPLATYTGGKPTLILFGYHRCPNLCGVAQLDLAEGLKRTGLESGTYRILFVSVDPEEAVVDAAAARDKLRQAGGATIDLSPWRFLVGDAAVLSALEASVGLTVAKGERDFYVHPVAISALTPDGRVSDVLSGLNYPSADLRRALVDASAGRLGTLGEHILLLCSAILGIGRYNDTALLVVRLVSIAAMLGLGGTVVFVVRRRTP
jgi:protein SCO1/2